MDDRRSFKTVHLRHADIEQDDGEVVRQYLAQGFRAGICGNHFIVIALRFINQQRFQRKQTGGVIIYKKYFWFEQLIDLSSGVLNSLYK